MNENNQLDLFPEELAEAEKKLDKTIWPEFDSEQDFITYAKQSLPISSSNTLMAMLFAYKNTAIKELKRNFKK